MKDVFDRLNKLSPEKRALLERQLAQKAPQPEERIQHQRGSGPFPLSFAQERLWFLDQLEPGSATYNLPAAIRLAGLLDTAALERSLNTIIERHEILRSIYTAEDGQPVQYILPFTPLTLQPLRITGATPEQRNAELERLTTTEASRPFDLEHGPMFHITLLQKSVDEHILLLTFHHIIFDGWSIGIFSRELSTSYAAYSEDRSAHLSELSIQYTDFAVDQRRTLQGAALEQQLAYWQQQLAHIPVTPLELPTDYPRPAVLRFQGSRHEFALPLQLSEALKTLSQSEDVTLFMLLLTAFYALLHHYTRQTDIPIGTPQANRRSSDVEDLIGLFVNTLVLRGDLSGNPRFRALLKRVREMCWDAYNHQDVPFEKIVEKIQPERNLSYNPLFQVIFALQNMPKGSLELPHLSIESARVDAKTTMFDLRLMLMDSDEGLGGILEYNSDLFTEATIEHMVQHFQTILASIVANPDQPIADLNLVSKNEYALLTKEWNARTETYVTDTSLHELFAAQAALQPDAPAIHFAEQTLTYQALNQRANHLTQILQDHHVGPEVIVGVAMERSLELVVTILGILKAGGAYLPLDPHYPTERLNLLIEDAHVALVVTDQASYVQMTKLHGQVLTFAELQDMTPSSPDRALQQVQPENLAYIIYTSGSTGRPKGVMISHAHVVRLFLATHHWFNFSSRDIWTLFHSYAFDFSVWELWGPLLHGGQLVVVPYWVSRTPTHFHTLLKERAVTVLNQTPSAFVQLLQSEEPTPARANLSLRTVIFGGEALHPRQLAPWAQEAEAKSFAFVNMYGITETTVHVTYRRLQAADILGDARSVIGAAIPDLQVYILNSYLNPVPVGMVGELYVGGAGVARGYLNRPELTAERFIPHPFSDQPGARLYRSGDLVRYLPNGDIEYMGRADDQVKIRGFRIELGEIEAAIARHADVQEVLVTVHSHATNNKSLIAYIIPRAQAKLSPSNLRQALQNTLPDYMIPAYFITLSSFPLTQHGKIDRQALPPPTDVLTTSEQSYVPPVTSQEIKLARIWSQILGIKRIGIHDNFFEMGGDSLRTIQVKSLAQKVGIFFSVQQFFQHQSIAELISVLQPTHAPEDELPSIAPFQMLKPEDHALLSEGLDDAYPMTLLQLGMIFHGQYNAAEGALAYHDVFSLHVQGRFDQRKLGQAIQHLLQRHPILRTSFELSRFSEPLQLVHKEVPTPLQSQDIRDVAPTQQVSALQALNAMQQRQSFDVTQAPLLQFQAHVRTNESFQLTLSFHHAILDGWSVATLITELMQTYKTLLVEENALHDTQPATSYRDFVYQEQQALHAQETSAYWQQILENHTQITLPTWTPSQAEEEASPLPQLQIALSQEIMNGLRTIASTARVPLKSVLLAAHMRVMSLLSGQSDVLTGLVTNGRAEGNDGERVLGLFLNTVPFRLQLQGGSWVQLVRQIFAAEQALWLHRRYPLAQIQKENGGAPLFDIYFDYRHFHVYHRLAALEEVKIVDSEFFEKTNFALTVNFNHALSNEQLSLTLKYDATKLSSPQIEAISMYYLNILQSMVTQPTAHYETAVLLPESDWRFVVARWNATELDYARERCLHQLFEEQASRTPDTIALVSADAQLSYGELNRRTNQLAYFLQEQGIQPDTPVGLLYERSLDMLIGVLGILKAGGAYVPLDPKFPQERLRFIIENAQIHTLLTQQRLKDMLVELPINAFYLDQLRSDLANYPTENVQSAVNSSNLAYVIYTSGSTGRPKGVMITHRNVLNFCAAMNQRIGTKERAHWLAVTSISFDISVLELFWPLTHGQRVVLQSNRPTQQEPVRGVAQMARSEDTYRPPLDSVVQRNQLDTEAEPQPISVEMTIQGISHLQVTPSLAQIILAEPQAKQALGQLQQLLVGGEPLPPTLAQQLSGQLAGALYNMYGPTETTIWSTTQQIHPDTTTISVGHPIGNTQGYILDAYLQPVPPGVAGHLYLGGEGLARGYLNRPDLTAERFIPDPFSTQPGTRLYQTGDIARYLPDGRLDLLGRSDFQLKIRGYRIEPGEIEAALRKHSTVREAVVAAREDAQGDRRLVAYIVPEASTQVGAEQQWEITLPAFLAESLPEYMRPSAYVALQALPLTTNGKLDRQALPAPDLKRSAQGTLYVEPTTPLEETLTQIWAEIVGVDHVGIEDNFFDLGGDSIKAVRLMDRIHMRLGVQPSLTMLFKYPTIAQLAQTLHKPEPESTLVPLATQQVREQRIFLIHPLGGHIFCYNPLAQAFDHDFTIYGLQARGFDGKQPPFKRIEDMAAYYIQEITSVQPEGPYIIGGWCMGGTIAFEVVRQLHAQGKQIALTALISADADHPIDTELANDRVATLLYALGLLQVPMEADIVDKLDGSKGAPDLVDQLTTQQLLPADMEPERVRVHTLLYQTHARALLNYQPEPYMGRLVLLRPEEAIPTQDSLKAAQDQSGNSATTPKLSRSWDLGWSKFALGGVEVIAIPGHHYSIMRPPYAEDLAKALKSIIQRASTEALQKGLNFSNTKNSSH